MRCSLQRAVARLALCVACCAGLNPSVSRAETWNPYLEFTGRAGGLSEVGQGNLFLPLFQDGKSLIFADLRGQWTDIASAEGNWGIAMRRIVNDDYVLGAYGFYDLRHSPNGENYHQATLGAELLTREWGFRFNTYLAEDGVRTGINTNARLSGDSIIVSNGSEAAYSGFDLETEALLFGGQGLGGSDLEVWAAAAYYHFEQDAAGFEDIDGPRLRVEARLFDLPMLGNGSRVVVGGQYQHDDVRGGLGAATASVRIPIGRRAKQSRRLQGLERRMITPVVRDIDVVTGGQTTEEQGRVANAEKAPRSIVVVNSETEDISGAIRGAGKNSLIIVDGEVFQSRPIELKKGQTIAGGGSVIEVQGVESGASTMLRLPGERGELIGSFYQGGPGLPLGPGFPEGNPDFPEGDRVLLENEGLERQLVGDFEGPFEGPPLGYSGPSIVANHNTLIHGLDIYASRLQGSAPLIVVGRGDRVVISETNLYAMERQQFVYADKRSDVSIIDSGMFVESYGYGYGYDVKGAESERYAGTVLEIDGASEFSMLRSEISRVGFLDDPESEFAAKRSPEMDNVLYASMDVKADVVNLVDTTLSVSDVRFKANQLTASGSQFDGLTAFISKGDQSSFEINNNLFTGSKVKARTSDDETLELALTENEFDPNTGLAIKADDGALVVSQESLAELAESNGLESDDIKTVGNVFFGKRVVR